MNRTRTSKNAKRLLVWLLLLTMVFGLLPMAAFADDAGEPVVSEEPVQEPTEPSSEPSAEPSSEPSQEPEPEQPGDAVVTIEGDEEQPEDEMLAAEIPFDYAEKTRSVRLGSGEFQRIFLLDCGRKYFAPAEVKAIIDELQKNHYTHIELAFGNDGLRFLLNDMSLTANGKNYTTEEVTAAIEYGNQQFCENNIKDKSASSAAWSQTDMDDIISYAGEHGIKVVPLFNAPGHMYAVIKAMENLGLTNVGSYVGYADSSPNWGLNVTNPAAVNFVKELVQKYVAYFAGKGCGMFNIGADESGITADNYSAYAQLVNSHAAMVQNSGMVAMAFNDGIYNPSYTGNLNGVKFDSDIVIAYWSYSGLATAQSLANMGFVINSTHNNWYYVLGKNDSNWAGYYTALNNMKTVKCNAVDSGITTNSGCTLAVWCDNPYVGYNTNSSNVKTLISTFASENSGYFVAPQKPVLTASKSDIAVGDTVTLTLSNYEGNVNWSCDKPDVLSLEQGNSNSVTATALSVGTAAVTATMADGETATVSITVAETVFDKTENITLVVGASSEPYVQDELYPTVEDMELVNDDGTVVASYTLTHTPGTEYTFTAATYVSANGKYYISMADGYLTADGSTTDDLSKAAEWTLTNRNVGGYYLQIGTRYLYYNGSSWTTGTNNSRTPIYFNKGTFYRTREWDWGYTYSNPLGVPGTRNGDKTDPKTNIVFKGLAVGTTSVIIGNVKYNITVVAEDLDKVSPLPIQLWITDNAIEASGVYAGVTSGTGWDRNNGSQTAHYINVPAAAKKDSSSINSAQGMTVVDAFAAAGMEDPIVRHEYGGTRYIAEQSNNSAALELAFWTGRIHNSSQIQTVYGTDYSNTGEEFTFVRYWGGVWEVSADRQNWITVTGKGSTGSLSGCEEQLVAYYMMRTKVTDEVTTDAADWGYVAGSTEYNTEVGKTEYVLLDFAVKYEDGTQNPKTFPQSGKTLAFNVNNSGTKDGTKYRMLNNFRAINSADYEVYMVTVKMTSDNASTEISQPTVSYAYDGEEQIVWALDEKVLNNSGLGPYSSISGSSTYSGCKIGGDPYIRGVEVYNKHGALITYYVRAIIKEDSLTVHYINRSASDYEFYKYGITVTEGTFFDENFKQVTPNTTELTGNKVKNSLGVEQTVIAELKDIPGIGAQYRYSEYTCVGTSRGDDGKNVYLYYTFNAAKTFVVDFGLPLKITPNDINEQLGEAYNNNRLTRVITGDSKYAAVTVEDKVITYTLNQTIDGRDDIVATYYGTQVTSEGVKENNVSYTLSFIPASNVYYEDSFAQVNNGKGAAKDATWVRTDNNSDARQALTELGKVSDSVYGYDSAYANNTQYSMNGYSKVTVTSAMASDTWDANNDAWPTATFTFKGTGFDVISLTNNQSGAILVNVYSGKTAEGKAIKKYIVDNYFGYEYTEEKGWQVTNNAGTLYQIPVMKITGLDYGEYTAVITVFYDGLFDNSAEKNSYSFWLDAIRVYDPMGENVSDYTKDKEGYPQYIELRTEIINKNKTNKDNATALFIDGAKAATVEQYKNFGPNNEVYLAKGQAISFTLPVNADIDTVQIGAKSPNASDTGKALMNVSINGSAIEQKEIGTATEMYYTISKSGADAQQVTIANTGDAILSLTNLKITYSKKSETSLEKLSADDEEMAVATVRALFAEPEQPEEPEKTFNPERFDCEWNKNVRKGGRAILTVKASTDVESILIDGEEYGKYVTRTERIGWGRNAQRVTYHEFIYMTTADEVGTINTEIVAVNGEGVQSVAKTVPLTVKESSPIRDWIGGLFGRWF